MRRSSMQVCWAFVSACLLACENETPAASKDECGPDNCAGCCAAGGRCELGTSAAACGSGGASCVDCGTAGFCHQDGRCGSGESDAGTPSDAGLPDSGLTADGGQAPDAATDAGAQGDAGETADAGLQEDAGLLADAGGDAGGEPDASYDAGEAADASSDAGNADDAGIAEDAGASADAGAPTGESCQDPLQLAAGASTTSGTTGGASDDDRGSCGGEGGADVVYRFHLDQPLALRAIATASGSGLQPVLYLRGNPCAGPELACAAASSAGGEAFVEVAVLPAGDWFLFVDGAAGSQGAYGLELRLTPPPEGDSCLAPSALAFSGGPAGGGAAAFGDTRSMHDDAAAACGGAGARDRVYAFATDRPLSLQVRVTPDTATFRPAVYLQQGTCGGAEIGCAVASGAGNEALLELPGLAAGTYFLWVDGAAAAGGLFTLEAVLTP